jgi:DNA-binding XRE family transcriptional regulator
MEQNSKSMDTEPASNEAAGTASSKAGTTHGGAKSDKRGATQSSATQSAATQSPATQSAATQNRARGSRVSSRSANKTVQQTGSKQTAGKQTSKQKSRAKPPNGVREARIERMMSKAELARRAGLSVLTIDRVEKGLESRMDTKRKILEALGLSLNDRVRVFGEEE